MRGGRPNCFLVLSQEKRKEGGQSKAKRGRDENLISKIGNSISTQPVCRWQVPRCATRRQPWHTRSRLLTTPNHRRPRAITRPPARRETPPVQQVLMAPTSLSLRLLMRPCGSIDTRPARTAQTRRWRRLYKRAQSPWHVRIHRMIGGAGCTISLSSMTKTLERWHTKQCRVHASWSDC